jgi:hypothetical protein
MPVTVPSNAVEALSQSDFLSKLAMLPKASPIVCDGVLIKGETVEIEGRAVYGAGKGLRITDLRNGLQAHRAMVRVIGGKLFNAELDTCDGTAVGVFGMNSVVAACHIHHAGHNGIACSSATSEHVHGQPEKNSDNQNALLAFNEIHEINCGLPSPTWAGAPDTFNLNGKWYVNPGWEAMGIGKFAWCSGVRVIGNHVYRVHGPGIWGDVYGWMTLIDGNLVHECFGIREAFMGMGISNELMFDTVIRRNVCYGNTGSDIQTAESADVLIEGNWVEEIEMRALARAPGHRNVTVRDNHVRTKIFFSVGSGPWTDTGNVIGQLTMPTINVGPEHVTSDMVSVPDTVPGAGGPEPVGERVPWAQSVVLTDGTTYTVESGKIARAGITDQITNGVIGLWTDGKVLYQGTQHGTVYKLLSWPGKWEPVSDPRPYLSDGLPGDDEPPTDPPDPTVDELLARIEVLNDQLALAKAQATDLQKQLDARRAAIKAIADLASAEAVKL